MQTNPNRVGEKEGGREQRNPAHWAHSTIAV